jgi:hypothetical protein
MKVWRDFFGGMHVNMNTGAKGEGGFTVDKIDDDCAYSPDHEGDVPQGTGDRIALRLTDFENLSVHCSMNYNQLLYLGKEIDDFLQLEYGMSLDEALEKHEREKKEARDERG